MTDIEKEPQIPSFGREHLPGLIDKHLIDWEVEILSKAVSKYVEMVVIPRQNAPKETNE